MNLTPSEQAILDALVDGPLDGQSIAEAVGLSYRTLYNSKGRYLGKLRTLKLIHVAEWRRGDGSHFRARGSRRRAEAGRTDEQAFQHGLSRAPQVA